MFNFSTIVHATDIAGIQTPARHLHTLLFLLLLFRIVLHKK